ncbi:hypothetical protein ARMSODRAFT_983198 [Armillaria solidipes]|uniref:Uncharacterized protein n=1 Tax=Armillaria solidipes TaxID=1076256 RepID=A0A2H3AK34_9AGAR|nr:hypothetical protein ARMSODRAFT_983198 [Armillaria solidipes]
MTQHMKDVASQNADKDRTRAARIACAEEAIDECDPYRTSQALEEAYKIRCGANGYLTVAALDLQLDWHIKNSKNGSGLEIPKAKSGAKGRGDRESRYRHLQAAISKYEAAGNLAVEAEHAGAETEVESSQEEIIDVDVEGQDDSEDEFYSSVRNKLYTNIKIDNTSDETILGSPWVTHGCCEADPDLYPGPAWVSGQLISTQNKHVKATDHSTDTATIQQWQPIPISPG